MTCITLTTYYVKKAEMPILKGEMLREKFRTMALLYAEHTILASMSLLSLQLLSTLCTLLAVTSHRTISLVKTYPMGSAELIIFF